MLDINSFYSSNWHCVRYTLYFHNINILQFLIFIGFFKTERRSDRDKYVTILYENIIPGYQAYFAILPTIQTCGCYDCSSAMHSLPTYLTANGLPTIEAKNSTSCRIARNKISPLSNNDINCIQNMYFGYDNSCKSLSPTFQNTTSPTVNPTFKPIPAPEAFDFCLYGDHANSAPSPTPATMGNFFMGHYSMNGTHNGKEYYVQERTSYKDSPQYPFIIYWTGKLWGISLNVGGGLYSYCKISVDYPRNCGNNWGKISSIHKKLNTKYGECNIARCQSISAQVVHDYRCNGKFHYISDNLYGNTNRSMYWAFNDFRGQWLCGDSIYWITTNGYDGVYHSSNATTFPILSDGVELNIPSASEPGHNITIHCNGNVTVTTKSPTTRQPTITPTSVSIHPTFTTFVPTGTPITTPSIYPTIVPTKTPTNTPTMIPSNQPSNLPTFYPSNIPTMNPSESVSQITGKESGKTTMDTTTIILIIGLLLALLITIILICLLIRVCYRRRMKSNNMNKEKGDKIEISSVTPKCLAPSQPSNHGVYDSVPLRHINEGGLSINYNNTSSDDSDVNSTVCQPRLTITEDVRLNQQSGLLQVTRNESGETQKDKAFKIYYNELFDGVLLQYYDNIVYNRVNDIDTLILLDNTDDLNQYNIITNKFHQIKFVDIVKQIKIERHKWIKCLKKINLYYAFINVFDKHGIYTINEFKKRFKNVDELND